jgi:hypothetical protein
MEQLAKTVLLPLFACVVLGIGLKFAIDFAAASTRKKDLQPWD